MSCNPELVSAFLDGELDNVIVDSVAKHLLKCDTCCKTLSKLAQVRDALADQFAMPDPEGFTASVMAAIRQENPHGGATLEADSPLHNRLLRFGVPAALTAAALAGWMQSQPHLKAETLSSQETTASALSTPPATPITFR